MRSWHACGTAAVDKLAGRPWVAALDNATQWQWSCPQGRRRGKAAGLPPRARRPLCQGANKWGGHREMPQQWTQAVRSLARRSRRVVQGTMLPWTSPLGRLQGCRRGQPLARGAPPRPCQLLGSGSGTSRRQRSRRIDCRYATTGGQPREGLETSSLTLRPWMRLWGGRRPSAADESHRATVRGGSRGQRWQRALRLCDEAARRPLISRRR